ncbi:MAG: hypothetical protein AAB217_03925, partial [Chloroflexota bacterium]
MNTKGTAFKIIRYFIAIGILVSGTARWGAPATGKAYATGTAAIGGCIYTGAGSVTYTLDPLGIPVPTWNTVYAPNPAATPITNAQVMVQNQHSGGAFITYGTVTGNCWTATVPAPGDYIVMLSAPGHDSTSREFTVDDLGNVTNPTGSGATQNAYLPPLLDEDGWQVSVATVGGDSSVVYAMFSGDGDYAPPDSIGVGVGDLTGDGVNDLAMSAPNGRLHRAAWYQDEDDAAPSFHL